ncbi:hypothetical protein RCL1_002064 [Eukaryota sp. TZLM3-RCL]
MTKLTSKVCPLHLGLFQNAVSLPCHHSFCRSCIQQHLASNNECPVCSNPIPNSSVDYSKVEVERTLSDLNVVQYIDPNQINVIQELPPTHSFHLLKVSYQNQELLWKQLKSGSQDMVNTLSNQFSLLQALDFPKDIVKVYGVTQSPPGLLIEQLSCSLQDKFNSGYSFTRKEVVLIIKSLLDGVGSLHAHGIGHCNITAENVMLNEIYGQITAAKVSIPERRSVSERSQPITKTTYSAPELSSTHCTKPRNSLSIDVYALGVLFTGLILNRDPLLVIPTAESHSQQCLENLGVSGKLYLLLSRMLNPTPIKRPCIIEVGHLIFKAVDEHYQGPSPSEMSAKELKPETTEAGEFSARGNLTELVHRVLRQRNQKQGSLFCSLFLLIVLALFILGASLVVPSFVLSTDDQFVKKAGQEVLSRLPSLFYVQNPDDIKEQKQLLTIEISTIFSDLDVTFTLDWKATSSIGWDTTSSLFECRLTSNSASRLLKLSSIQFQLSSRGRVDRAISNLVSYSFDDLPSASTDLARVEAVNNEVGKVIEGTSVSYSTQATETPIKYKVVLTHDDVTADVEITVLLPIDILVNYRARILQHQFTCLEVENVEDAEQRIQVLKRSIENIISDETVNIQVEPQGNFNTFNVSLYKGKVVVTFIHSWSSYIARELKSADYIALGSMSSHGMALSNGSLWSWGDGDYGQLAGNRGSGTTDFAGFTFPQSPTNFTTIKQVALGCDSSLLLFNDGHVRVAGDSSDYIGAPSGLRYDTPVIIPGLSEVERVFAGCSHYAALSQGFLWMWGKNHRGQLGLGHNNVTNTLELLMIPNNTAVMKAALGFSHTLVLTVLGDVYAFGFNLFGDIGDGTLSLLCLSPVQVLDLETVVDIAVGPSSSYALTASGSVYAWGYNFDGQLCINSTKNQIRPQLVKTAGFQVKSIHASHHFVLFLTTDGRLYGCGYNGDHQLLSSSSDNQLLPVRVSDFDNVKSVAVGPHSVIATLYNGTSYAWGSNKNNKLGFKEGTTIKEPTRFGCNRF